MLFILGILVLAQPRAHPVLAVIPALWLFIEAWTAGLGARYAAGSPAHRGGGHRPVVAAAANAVGSGTQPRLS